ncbi:MAG: multidrug ABC transporter permease [Bacteroidetes bacterium GWE2_29_8]|nr:MAG: multidrug ABC transporter permease [Bacteroidetes bacterium GWE2_29_8]OFY22384.1 MAG: multidrug ABC transporter permease [Bacteroidetes bacterium GWF2_29_10]
MNIFKGFVIKEFIHIFRDYRTMVILFGIPLVQLLLFGFVIKSEIKDADIAIYDQAKDNHSKRITNKLLSSGYFRLDKDLDNYDGIHQAFREGKVKLVIIFEQNFSEKLEKTGNANVQILADASEPNTANLLVSYSNAILSSYIKDLNSTSKMPYNIITEIRMEYNPELKSVYMFVPGIMALLLMLISAMMTSISITKEKEMGTMEVLLASPIKPFVITAGKVVPYIFLSIINVLIILSISYYVFDVPIKGSLFLLVSVCILFILTALSLGILISTVTNSQQVAMMISLVALMLPSILLSGFIFPIENMPIVLQYLCQLMPPRWFIEIIRNIMLKGVSFSFIWKETCVLFIMMIVFNLLSIKKFKIRLE